MGYALIVVDMTEDNLRGTHPVATRARELVPRINELTSALRGLGVKIVFACDSFLPEDFIFKSRLKPHNLRGTKGCQVARDLVVQEGDMVVEKRRFSAFFKTDLDQTLRTWGVDTLGICGITLPYCVLATVLDALSHDFSVVILEDFTVTPRDEDHQTLLNPYRQGPLHPLLRVMTGEEFLREVGQQKRGP